MKLSGQQIQALAEKISKELSNDISKRNQEIKNQKEAWYLKKLSLKENKGLKEFYENHKNSYQRNDIRCFLEDKYPTEAANLPIELGNRISTNDIRTDIVLETIECENIDEIIKKIKSKYQK